MRRRFINNSDAQYPTNINNYLTVEALEDGLTVSLSTNACRYCVDGDGNWISLAAGAETESIKAGQTLSLRGNLTPSGYVGIGTFTISKKCNLKGNCMSMLYDANAPFITTIESCAFYRLFYNCANIVNVSENFLPATILHNHCYDGMFSGCSSLTTAPELPASTLESYCYMGMFSGCTSILNAPDICVDRMQYWCCMEMSMAVPV